MTFESHGQMLHFQGANFTEEIALSMKWQEISWGRKFQKGTEALE
jgi:hypothetical protein